MNVNVYVTFDDFLLILLIIIIWPKNLTFLHIVDSRRLLSVLVLSSTKNVRLYIHNNLNI